MTHCSKRGGISDFICLSHSYVGWVGGWEGGGGLSAKFSLRKLVSFLHKQN